MRVIVCWIYLSAPVLDASRAYELSSSEYICPLLRSACARVIASWVDMHAPIMRASCAWEILSTEYICQFPSYVHCVWVIASWMYPSVTVIYTLRTSELWFAEYICQLPSCVHCVCMSYRQLSICLLPSHALCASSLTHRIASHPLIVRTRVA